VITLVAYLVDSSAEAAQEAREALEVLVGQPATTQVSLVVSLAEAAQEAQEA
jgi:hypothetical protein